MITLPLEECMAAIIDYRGKSPRKTSIGVPLITAKIVKGGRIETPDEFIDPSEYDEWMRRGVPEVGDVVITTEAPLGEVAQLSESRIALAQRLILLRGKPGLLHNTYLKYLLMSDEMQRQLASRASGTTVVGIKQSELRKLTLSLPSITEQEAIAGVLGALDDKIEQNLRTGLALEALARAMFKAWFVDFEPVRAKAAGAAGFTGMSPAAFAALPDRVVDCPLGQVPEGWEVTTLEDATTTVETGKRPRGGVGGYSSGVPSIGAESITRIGEYDFGKTKYVPEAFFEAMKKGVLSDGDVLLYKDGGRPGDFQPHVSMVGRGFPFDRMCINEHVFRIRARSPLTQSYLYLWLSSEPTMEEMRRRGTGVAIPGLSAVAAKQIATLVPTESVVKAFENIAEPLLSLCLQQAAESSKLAALRDYLLPRLLSGRVRVRDAEKIKGV